MPADYAWSDAHALIVGRLSGVVLPEEVLEALGAAMATGRYPAGADRITLVEPGARMHRLDLSGLRRIQAVVAAHEHASGRTPEYQSAIVCDDVVKRPIVELYRMLWSAGPFRDVSYRVTSSAAQALDWLGRPHDALDPELLRTAHGG